VDEIGCPVCPSQGSNGMESRIPLLEVLTNGVDTKGGLIRQRSTGPSKVGFFPNAIHILMSGLKFEG